MGVLTVAGALLDLCRRDGFGWVSMRETPVRRLGHHAQSDIHSPLARRAAGKRRR